MERAARTDSAAARIAAVARKEAIDIFRDRRAILVTLVTAIVAGPVMMLLVLNLVARQADRVREMTLPVAGSEHAPALVAFLERQQVTLTPAPADFEDRVRRGDLDVVLEIDKDFAADVAKGKSGTVHLVFDRSRDRARASIAEAEALLRAYNREWGRGRLLLRGVAGEVANPLNVESRDLATPQSSGALVLFLIAFYGLFAAVMGGMAAALDTTAGERERASLEPLLTTPVAPLELATGKWLAVVALDAAAVVLTLTGFYLVLRFAPLPAVGIPFLFGLRELGRFVVALVPLMLLMPAVLLYVGTRGRSFKEAQSNLSVLLFAISLVPIVQMFLQRKDPPWLTWIPISGQYALLSRALRGEALQFVELAQSYVGPALLTAVALVAVARLFSRESILAGK
ncbi:MAG TPA: ABC transporter permease subunit [Casimicrobiaceae bacterium]|nr:ABC transporter permease subunit [Casimicrobiaceae bacterium]